MKSFVILLFTVLCFTEILAAQDAGKDFIQLSDPVKETEDFIVFGSLFNSELPSISLDALINNSGNYKKEPITTEGTVKKVCKKKGCFFMLESNSNTARISFKDYSFFVPTNTAGSRVKINGIFSADTISEADAKHYAEDAGDDRESITGPQEEYAIVATSVMIYK